MAKTSAPKTTPTPLGITSPKGFYAAGLAAGIKKSGKKDLMLLVSDRPCAAAGVFTTSLTPAEPILVTKAHLKTKGTRAVVVNAGNANASTGARGLKNAQLMCKLVADEIGCTTQEVLVASTGIIGVPLPMDKVVAGIASAIPELGSDALAAQNAAEAIMTTDLTAKTAGVQLKLGGKTCTLAGICKGSGMIAPNMATMLGFIACDAQVAPAALSKALKEATRSSFNRISVDQHTSCSDAVLVLANGAAENAEVKAGSADYKKFLAALTDLCKQMAEMIVRDGEGATKVFHVTVANAKNEKEADLIAKAIVNSPLVKCAVYGGDPNWGRIVTAAGYSGAKGVDLKKMKLAIGQKGQAAITVYQNGAPAKQSAANFEKLQNAMKAKDICMTLSMGAGKSQVTWLGCDLSYDYVKINAEYTT